MFDECVVDVQFDQDVCFVLLLERIVFILISGLVWLDQVVVVWYFYDIEFIEDGYIIELILIGVVVEDGCEYYVVFMEFDFEWVGSWVCIYVLFKLLLFVL